MSPTFASRLGWTLCASAVAVDVLAIALGVTAHAYSLVALVFPVAFLVLPVVGALVVTRQPHNAIGWLFLGAALVIGISSACYGYAALALTHGRSLAGGVAAAWLSTWLFLPALFGVPPLLFLLFPNGRSLTPRWRPAVWVTALGIVLGPGGNAILPGPLSDAPVAGVDNPAGVEGPLYDTLGTIGWAITLVAGGLATASLVLRYRRSRGQERLQMRWFVSSALAFLLGLLANVALFPTRFVLVGPILVIIGFSAVPLATGLAILRYRLYDIDLVINRTLVYATLTVTLAVVYLTSVLLLRLVLAPVTGQSDLAVAASTLAVAGLFRPLRARIQATVDRRFFRSHYDAALTLETFGVHLRHEVDLENVSGELRSVVRDTMQPAHVTLWLRGSEATR